MNHFVADVQPHQVPIRQSDQGLDRQIGVRRSHRVHQVQGRQHRLQRGIVQKEKLKMKNLQFLHLI